MPQINAWWFSWLGGVYFFGLSPLSLLQQRLLLRGSEGGRKQTILKDHNNKHMPAIRKSPEKQA